MKKFLQVIGNLFNLKVLTNDEYNKLIDAPPTIDVKPTKPTTLLKYSKIVTMLREYDNTRFEHLVNTLGFEDTRVNTFDFAEVKNYLAYAEKLATEKGIKLKGLSFVKGVYTEENRAYHEKGFISYESLMYLPTAIVEGKETEIDLAHSSKDKIISFKEVLAENGYKWRYDNEKNFISKNTITNSKENIQTVTNKVQLKSGDSDSLVANYGHLKPPRA